MLDNFQTQFFICNFHYNLKQIKTYMAIDFAACVMQLSQFENDYFDIISESD